MEISERPQVLLLSLLKDGRQKNLVQLTEAFEDLLEKIYEKHCNPHEMGCPLQTDALAWLDSVEMTLKILEEKKWIVKTDDVSYKYRITSLGQQVFDKYKAELEEYFKIEL